MLFMVESDKFLILPGWQNSGPDHWQSHWEHDFSAQRVNQKDWIKPVCEEWLLALDNAIESTREPIVLICHSLGCLTVARWAQSFRTHHAKIKGAFLVSPPDLTQDGAPPELASFLLVPAIPLPFPSLVIGTSNDPWASMIYFEQIAKAWGSSFMNVGAKGHLGSDSTVANWPEGKKLLSEFLASLA